MMNKKQDIVAISLHQTDSNIKESVNKTPQELKLACRIKDVAGNRDLYIYNGIDKYILYTLLKELERYVNRLFWSQTNLYCLRKNRHA